MSFQFNSIPDCVIIEAIDALPPRVWHRLAVSVPFVGDWTWHERTMLHLAHKDILVANVTELYLSFIRWCKNGHNHRDGNLPAIEYASCNGREWYRNGRLHRSDDLPAIEQLFGVNNEWYVNGQRHRDNGLPALVSHHDTYWFVNDQLHRDDDLPAIERRNGTKE